MLIDLIIIIIDFPHFGLFVECSASGFPIFLLILFSFQTASNSPFHFVFQY